MKSQFILFLNDEVAVVPLTREHSVNLIRRGPDYFFSARQRGDVLNHGLRYRILQAAKLYPRATRLVAYHTKEKTAIGFLYLAENTDWLFTIEYVFVDPMYRKMGLATGLLKYALKVAKEKGAKKVNLSVDSNSTKAIELYTKLGFEKIGHTLWVQGYLPGSGPSRLIRHFIMGQGCLTKLTLKKNDRLSELETNLEKTGAVLFNICQHSMDQDWMSFFETNADNLIKGSRHVWQPPFFRDVLVNDMANCYVIIFNSPFSGKATVELYSASDEIALPVLEDLSAILARRGIFFVQIMLINLSGNALSNWCEEKGMKKFHFTVMGKTL